MMQENYLAVLLVSGIISMVIGSIWYGPLFGKLFMREMGMDAWSKEKQEAMKKGMGLRYLGQFIASLVMFYVLTGLITGYGHPTAAEGAMTGFIVWLGFIVPVKFADLIWGGKKTLFWLNIGNTFVTLIIVGAIIGAWR